MQARNFLGLAPKYCAHEQKVRLAGRPCQQLQIQDLGNDDATFLLTKEAQTSPRQADNPLGPARALAHAVCLFHMDAVSPAFGLKVDFDLGLLVIVR